MADETRLGVLCHLLAPFTFSLGTLAVWWTHRDDPAVDAHGRRALNFSWTVMALSFGLFLLGVVLALILAQLGGVVILVVILLGLAAIVLHIVAAVRTSQGKPYEYPFALGFLKVP